MTSNSGSFQSLYLAARLGRLYNFTLKIGQTSGSLMAHGEKLTSYFRFDKARVLVDLMMKAQSLQQSSSDNSFQLPLNVNLLLS